MTGLDPESDTIIEIATIVTDKDLNTIEEGPSIAISQPAIIIDGMDEWNTEHHTNSGLVNRIFDSEYTMRMAEVATIDFLKNHVEPGISPMCGNTICQDRRFLCNYMPELEEFFHYRHIDVTTLKELISRWSPEKVMRRDSESQHLALADIRDSIEELKYYREVFINVE